MGLIKILIISLIVSVFMIGSATLFNDLSLTYEPNVSESFKTFYPSINQSANEIADNSLTDQTQDIARQIASNVSSANQNTIDTPVESQKAAAYAGIRTIFKLPQILFNLVTSFATYLRIPLWFLGLIFSISIVVIAIFTIKTIFNRIP